MIWVIVGFLALIWSTVGAREYLVWARARYDRMVRDFPSTAPFSFWDGAVILSTIWMALMGPFAKGYLQKQYGEDHGNANSVQT